jgi:hypothetical protein
MRPLLLFILGVLAVPAGTHAQEMKWEEDEARIEELVKYRAEAKRQMQGGSKPADIKLPALPAPPPLPEGIQPGPIRFEQLSALRGRWIRVRTKSEKVWSGELLNVKGSIMELKIGVRNQGAVLPLDRSNVRTLELLQ